MAILRSVDGKFYELSDDELEQYQVSEDLVSQIAQAIGGGGSGGPVGAPEAGPGGDEGPGGDVEPYHHRHRYRRRYRWRNCWHNSWRNCY